MQQPGWFETNNVNSFEEELFMAHDPESTDADRIQRIVDLKYKEADLHSVLEEAKDLSPKQQQQLMEVLQKFEVVFDGTLGVWQCEPIDIELKDPNCKPIHAKPYPVP